MLQFLVFLFAAVLTVSCGTQPEQIDLHPTLLDLLFSYESRLGGRIEYNIWKLEQSGDTDLIPGLKHQLTLVRALEEEIRYAQPIDESKYDYFYDKLANQEKQIQAQLERGSLIQRARKLIATAQVNLQRQALLAHEKYFIEQEAHLVRELIVQIQGAQHFTAVQQQLTERERVAHIFQKIVHEKPIL